MSRTRIKFCGMMRPGDALAAANCGADAIGLVFYKQAKRCVSIEQARAILAVLPPFVTPVGLFVNASCDEIISTASQLKLRHLQLHGDEKPELVSQLKDFAVLKALPVETSSLERALADWREAIARHHLTNLKGMILDTPGASHGGSGIANDWATVREHVAKRSFDGLPPIIAAGGLKPESVGEVVRTVRPWAVDVSSGVEDQFGIKSCEKMARFAAEVRAADDSQ